jgi:probable addiction module antidote protein
LLCGGNKSTQAKDIKAAQCPPHRQMERMTMTEKLILFDPAEHLKPDQAIADFMTAAFETSDPAYVAHALGVVTRAKGMTQIANQTGLSRENFIDRSARTATRRYAPR